MERAGRVVAKLRLAKHGVTPEQVACAAWAAAVGPKIAARTNAVSLVRERLVVQVEDAVWQKQLWTLRSQILRRLEEILGSKQVLELEFRIAVPRRAPVRAEVPHRADEADDIRDPMFRNIYISARRKATA